jgi:DNA-binding CsgD family transcriptional regulator/tetratricopeptide (TPR) repeat protein
VANASVRLTDRRLVGREDELRLLSDAFERGVAGQPATVLVTGDAGLGKTRLVAELSAVARRRGARVVYGDCVELGNDGLPYAPFVAIVRSLVRELGVGDVLELAGRAGGDLARLAPALDPSSERMPEATSAGQARLSMALVSLFEGLARRAPLVLVLEDLHWADASTRELLPLVVRALLPARAVVVITYRSEELPDADPARRLFAEITRSAASVRIELGPLSRPQQALQLTDILGSPPTRELLDAIYRRAEGNPFFAEELLTARASGEVLPANLRDLLLGRVLSLPRATRDALRVAAAGGRAVPYQVLAATLAVDVATLEETLRPAFDHHVLTHDPHGAGYAFRHALLAEATASTLLPGEARHVHARLAAAYDADPGVTLGAADRAAALARHWHAAGDRARSLAASVAAARETARMLAFPESLRHYERALAAWDEVDDATTVAGEPLAAVLGEAAEIAHLAAYPERAASLCRAAIEHVDADADPVRAGLLHERLGRYLWMSADGVGALAAYRRAVDLVPPDPPTHSRARVLSGLSQALMLAGWMDESRDTAEAAIDIAQRVGARAIEGHARNNLGVNMAYLGDIERGVALLRQARQIAEEASDDVDDVARAIVNLGSALVDAGRLDEAAEVALDGVSVVADLGLERRKGVWCRCDAADALLRRGRWDDVERLIADAFALDPKGIDRARATWLRGVLRLRRGDLDGAAADLDLARDLLSNSIDEQFVGPFHAHLVELWVARGAPEHALAIADEGWDRLAEKRAPFAAPLAAMAVTAAAGVAERVAATGTRQAAESAQAAATRWLDRCRASVTTDRAGAPEPHAWYLTAQAEHHRAAGGTGLAPWAPACSRWQRAGQPYWQAYSQWRHAEALLGAGERTRARAVLRAARACSESLGAGLLHTEILALAGRARLDIVDVEPRDDKRADPYGLTPREREVLGMLAQGRTNRQIASRLFVSHRTVGAHVSNLLGKLGAHTRSEAAAIAHRERLL